MREQVIMQQAKERVRLENTQKLSSSPQYPNTRALDPSKTEKPRGSFISTMAVCAGGPGSFQCDAKPDALNHCISWKSLRAATNVLTASEQRSDDHGAITVPGLQIRIVKPGETGKTKQP